MMQFFSSAPKSTTDQSQESTQDPDVEDEKLRKESKYKHYKDEIVSVLKTFDQSKEWADLIRCLQRFNKVLKKYPQFPLIPEKLTVSKRLSQCLNAALPSGVHSKTLETYDEVFKHIKEKRTRERSAHL
ncbi:dopey [Acrasis kona]|uniref:Dopey n=1 Tax=Acrasis kona TaxID=1008807 RepID=A0AAW2YJA1_9EUKA